MSAILLLFAAWMAGLRFDAIGRSGFDPIAVVLALTAIGLSDATLHGALRLLWRDAYMSRYRRLTFLFRGQSVAAILAGGATAAVEEMVFRGVLLQGLLDAGRGTAEALAASAFVFGLSHLILDRRLAPFALWAMWEGVLLGGVYVMWGSLTVSMAVHAIHDIGGFTLFAGQRRTGWMMR